MRVSFFVTVPLIVIHQGTLPVNARPKKARYLKKEKSNGNIKCIDLSDFFYDIILGVASYPPHSDCNDKEEAEIATFLQETINSELRDVPGTINTQNKICSKPVNNRRRLLTHGSFSSNWQNKTSKSTRTGEPTRKSLLRSVEPQQGRILAQERFRAFIYVGGGRCRYCFYDNNDHRALSPAAVQPRTHSTKNNELRKAKEGRDLMYLAFKKRSKALPKVADIALCKGLYPSLIDFSLHKETYQARWSNAKKLTFFDKMEEKVSENMMGLYKAGDKFGVQLDMNHAVHVQNGKAKEKLTDTAMVHLPVKEGNIEFTLYAFDLPTNLADGMLLDDPLFIFINGIKLDLNLLISQPNVRRIGALSDEVLTGSSFAGIEWTIARWLSVDEDFAYGPLPDNVYTIEITAPLVVLSHYNQLDLDFMIKPNAKATKGYAIYDLTAELWAAQCRVTGLENSPFQEFKSAVESRLFHKLGKDLARKFQQKEGHCLYDRIPVVDVNLVEKKNWKETNPRCGDR